MLLYTLVIRIYYLVIKIASLFNAKAKAWIKGRQQIIKNSSEKKTIWFHCASLGEYEQCRSVLRALKKAKPNYHYLVSFFSPSGYQHVHADNEFDQKIYIPVDLKNKALEWIPNMNIILTIWVKNDFWYNHMQVLTSHKIPFISLSTTVRKDHFYLKSLGSKFRNLLNQAQTLFVQDQDSYDILKQSGFNNVSISGDTRVDQIIDLSKNKFKDSLISKFKAGKPLLILASTHEEDDSLYMPLLGKLSKLYKIIIAPHDIHAKRIDKIKEQIRIPYLSYSNLSSESEQELTDVLVLDNIGMLAKIYRQADLVYVGGGFGKGIHNIMEPAIHGIPITFGPKYRAFNEANYFIEHQLAFALHKPEDFEVTIFRKFDFDQLDHIKNGLFNYFKIFGGGTKKVASYIEDQGFLS